MTLLNNDFEGNYMKSKNTEFLSTDLKKTSQGSSTVGSQVVSEKGQPDLYRETLSRNKQTNKQKQQQLFQIILDILV